MPIFRESARTGFIRYFFAGIYHDLASFEIAELFSTVTLKDVLFLKTLKSQAYDSLNP
jgi:hypothetical protein